MHGNQFLWAQLLRAATFAKEFLLNRLKKANTGGNQIDQHQAQDAFRVGQCETSHDISTSAITDSNTDWYFQFIQHFEQHYFTCTANN